MPEFECWVCNDEQVVVHFGHGVDEGLRASPCICVPWRRLRARMENVAEWAAGYDGEIAGAIRDVLADDERAKVWDGPPR